LLRSTIFALGSSASRDKSKGIAVAGDRGMVSEPMYEFIEKAQAYVGASNDHDLVSIEAMLAPDCIYRSASVGRHDGFEAILAMMKPFFASYPDVHWQAENYQWLSDCVKFDFVITLGEKSSLGVEKIYFDGDGRISRIEVQR
jgi:hypothetical protein